MKRALILGIGGQDGSYLADILLEKGYEVHGLYRRSSVDNLWRIRHCIDRITLHRGDVADSVSVGSAFLKCEPDEIYNEADQDDVAWSKEIPRVNADVTYGAVGRLMEMAVRWKKDTGKDVRIFQPLSATMFGGSPTNLIYFDESSKLEPRSPYACAKVGAWYLCQHYRREYGVQVACGILFNHDSPRRGPNYLLQKICTTVLAVERGERPTFAIRPNGMTDSWYDVGYAKDYMNAAHLMLQQEHPGDYVISNMGFSLSGLFLRACETIGIDYNLMKNQVTWTDYEGDKTCLIGNRSEIKDALGWRPTTPMQELITMIIKAQKEKNK